MTVAVLLVAVATSACGSSEGSEPVRAGPVSTEPATTGPATSDSGVDEAPVAVVVLRVVGQTPPTDEAERLEERMQALGFSATSRVTGDEVELRITGMDEATARENFPIVPDVDVRPVRSIFMASTATLPGPGSVEADGVVTLPDRSGSNIFTLGEDIDLAIAVAPGVTTQPLEGEWTVVVGLTSRGQDVFNDLAAECFTRSAECPEGRVAIVVDGEVIAALAVQEPTFGDSVTLSGSFSEDEATALAQTLEYGALPASYEVVSVEAEND